MNKIQLQIDPHFPENPKCLFSVYVDHVYEGSIEFRSGAYHVCLVKNDFQLAKCMTIEEVLCLLIKTFDSTTTGT